VKLSDDAEARYRTQAYPPRESLAGVEILELRRFGDAAGSMTELGRVEGGAFAGSNPFSLAQVNYSTVEPGAVKAFHVHRAQTDLWFVPPEDRVLLVLADVRKGSPTEGRHLRLVLGDTRSLLVRIPPGVAHGCRNLGATTARIVYFTDRHFDPDPSRTDEGRLPWDFLGPGVWEAPRE
jgi:dTDP-4-dehydrorhamnose 3,5-epimerase